MLHASFFRVSRVLFPVVRVACTAAAALRGALTPVHLLATLPLLLAGAFLGLLAGGAAVGLPALSGLLILIDARLPAAG
jgi:HAE1 family hydrophobic/amphiphilic exporter-1